jgi:hypothetical protein
MGADGGRRFGALVASVDFFQQGRQKNVLLVRDCRNGIQSSPPSDTLVLSPFYSIERLLIVGRVD